MNYETVNYSALRYRRIWLVSESKFSTEANDEIELKCSQGQQLREVEISRFQDSQRASALGRIVSGQPAIENQFPYQCSVLSPVGVGFSVCGGSIISSGWVLTGRFIYLMLKQEMAKCVDNLSGSLYCRIFATYLTFWYTLFNIRWTNANRFRSHQPSGIQFSEYEQ